MGPAGKVIGDRRVKSHPYLMKTVLFLVNIAVWNSSQEFNLCSFLHLTFASFDKCLDSV